MGMALKTLWIVPRWSGRLERGGYVKGHDPEVSKAPIRRSCFHDMTSYVYMSLWLDQRSHGKAERSIPARPPIVFTLRIQLDCKHSWYRWHEFQSWWIANQEFEERKETKRSQVPTRSRMWSRSGLVVVWIGSGSVWIRVWIGPEVDPHVCVCSMTRKGRQGVQAASVQLGCLAGGLQHATVSALQFDSLDAQQLQLGCWTAWLLSSVALSKTSTARKLYNSLLLGYLAGWITAKQETQKHANHHWTRHHSKGLDQRSGLNPFERSGSEVWIGGLGRVWDRGLIQTLHFEPQPHGHLSNHQIKPRRFEEWGLLTWRFLNPSWQTSTHMPPNTPSHKEIEPFRFVFPVIVGVKRIKTIKHGYECAYSKPVVGQGRNHATQWGHTCTQKGNLCFYSWLISERFPYCHSKMCFFCVLRFGVNWPLTPWKSNIEHSSGDSGGLEDDFPFPRGDFTLPETNIAPENGWLEHSLSFGMAYFQVLC